MSKLENLKKSMVDWIEKAQKKSSTPRGAQLPHHSLADHQKAKFHSERAEHHGYMADEHRDASGVGSKYKGRALTHRKLSQWHSKQAKKYQKRSDAFEAKLYGSKKGKK